MAYHNTSNSKGAELLQAINKAETQDQRIKALINKYSGQKLLTARRVWYFYRWIYGPIQLTSIRRSLTGLIKDRVIEYGDR